MKLKLNTIKDQCLKIVVLFMLLFGAVFFNVIGLGFLDEMVVVSLFFIIFIGRSGFRKVLFIYMTLCVIYLFYSISLGYNSSLAIISDLLVQSKPVVTLLIILHSGFRLSLSHSEKLYIRILIYFLSVIVVYLSSLPNGIENYFTHNSRLNSIALVLCLFYLSTVDDFDVKNVIISGLILSIGLLGIKSKFLAEYFVFIFMSILMILNYSIKVNSKSIVLFSILTVFVMLVSWERISLFFIDGVGVYEIYARPALYIASLEILIDHLFLGSGYASFGSYHSANELYYSTIYYDYGLDSIYGLTETYNKFVSDTYFPVLIGQFGVFGIGLFCYFISYTIRLLIDTNNNNSNQVSKFIIVFLIICVVIESTTDSTLTQNRGVFYMMLLSIHINRLRFENVSKSLVKES